MWDLPDVKSGGGALKAIGLVVNDWQLSGIWTGADRRAPTPSASATRTAAAT